MALHLFFLLAIVTGLCCFERDDGIVAGIVAEDDAEAVGVEFLQADFIWIDLAGDDIGSGFFEEPVFMFYDAERGVSGYDGYGICLQDDVIVDGVSFDIAIGEEVHSKHDGENAGRWQEQTDQEEEWEGEEGCQIYSFA